MKTYVFDGIFGIVAMITANSMDEAIKKFKKIYPQKFYACVYEQ
jgi:hypothetical protein